MKTILAVFLLFALADLSISLPLGKEETRECYGFVCPSGTVACAKKSKTTEDGKNLLTTVHCQNTEGDILEEHSRTELNPFGSGTQFSSYSFTGNYHYTSSYPGGNRRNEINNHNYHNFNNEVETV